ncbi:MAG: type II/IV secretion system protein [Deltaproteobacteria bacterium]|nr:MAG: type II/IV secretion system protein [Deltaproteobacteria bacterium]TNF30606.1 MAG: type II/IV secretion system protein [Deltaproteobacteria bacterium]
MEAVKLDESNRTLGLEEVLRAMMSDGLVDRAQAELILAKRKKSVIHPMITLSKAGIKDKKPPHLALGMESLMLWLQDYSGVPYEEIDPLRIDLAEVSNLLPQAYVKRLKVLPIKIDQEVVTIATAEPFERDWISDVERQLRRKVELVLASPLQIAHYLDELYTVHKIVKKFNAKTDIGTIRRNPEIEKMLSGPNAAKLKENDSDISSICHWLIQYAFDERATDIHIEPKRGKGQIRFRIDGTMRVVYKFTPEVVLPIVSRLKVLGGLKVDEKRRPQDGRIRYEVRDRAYIEMRLSTIGTPFGEKLVCRLFDPTASEKTMTDLGFYDKDIHTWNSFISHTHGMILVTGPTGSGKSTTLHSTLRRLHSDAVNICTVEDPIEIINDNFNQMQVMPQIGVTFANAVRAFLRQDPDIIMVGEIREKEGGEMAIQASLTGHLVLSTLHTNSALAAIPRLIDLGVAPHMINASLRGILAQRLVRVLCKHCKERVETPIDAWQALVEGHDFKPPSHVYVPKGCSECKNTGFVGRACIYEIVPYTKEIMDMVNKNTSLLDLEKLMHGKFDTIKINGARKVLEGLTSIEEVLRVAH